MLVAFGADMNALNSANQTPLDLLKGQRVISQCLHWPFHAAQKEATLGRVSSPIQIPPAKRPCYDNIPAVDRAVPKSQDIVNIEEKGTATLKRRRFQKERSMSLTSSPNMAELLQPNSSRQAPPQLSITSTLEKGAEQLSGRRVSKLTGVLQGAGAECRQKLIRNAFSQNRKSRITFDTLSESMSESEVKPSSNPFKPTGNCHELMNVRLKYYTLLQNLIKKCTNISDRFPRAWNEKLNLAMHMREARLLQMAGSRILFLDGGGIRGLIQIEILSQVPSILMLYVDACF